MTDNLHSRLKSQVRIDEYRLRASSASALAEACDLPQIRERHEAAAGVWTKLADEEERRAVSGPRRDADDHTA